MIVTSVEAITKAKYKIEIDGAFAFVLYKGERKRYGIEEGQEISVEIYEKIRKDIILKRAKLRAMHLLTDMARTEKGLRDKLRQGLYPADIIEEAMAYVRSFGYLNDYQYALNYIDSYKNKKSRKELLAGLLQKGVSEEQISLAMEECYEGSGEQEAIKALILKRRVNPSLASEEELYKLYGYLARKGFRYEEIRKVIENMKSEID